MKRVAENIGTRGFAVMVAAVLAVGGALSALGQDKTAKIHGHVNNAAGQVIQNASVRLTTDKTTDPKKVTWKYTFPIDASGDYKGEGIAPDTYPGGGRSGGSGGRYDLDYFADQTFKAGGRQTGDVRHATEGVHRQMTPEQRTALEGVQEANRRDDCSQQDRRNLNAMLKTAREANAAGKFADGAAAMTTATQQAPDQAILWLTLGDSQLGLADQAAKEAKAAGKSQTDDSVTSKYAVAATSYKKAIDLGATAKKAEPGGDCQRVRQAGRGAEQERGT